MVTWFGSTDYKIIGNLYFGFGVFSSVLGSVLSGLIELEFGWPGSLFQDDHDYNVIITAQAMLMIFLAPIPTAIGFGNWVIPPMIHAPNMAFPRINNMSFWMLPTSLALLLFSSLCGFSGSNSLFCSPASAMSGLSHLVSVNLAMITLFLAGLSSILGAANIIATIFLMRAPGMGLDHIPVLGWEIFLGAIIFMSLFPYLVSDFTALLSDRHLTCNFSMAGSGVPPLLTKPVWFFSHPEYYMLYLPVLSIVTQFIIMYSGKGDTFGPIGTIYAMATYLVLLGITDLTYHTIFKSMDEYTQSYLTLVTFYSGVPTGMKVFWWFALSYDSSSGQIMSGAIWVVRLLLLFTLGMLAGIMLAFSTLDISTKISNYVVTRVLCVLSMCVVIANFAWINLRLSENSISVVLNIFVMVSIWWGYLFVKLGTFNQLM